MGYCLQCERVVDVEMGKQAVYRERTTKARITTTHGPLGLGGSSTHTRYTTRRVREFEEVPVCSECDAPLDFPEAQSAVDALSLRDKDFRLQFIKSFGFVFGITGMVLGYIYAYDEALLRFPGEDTTVAFAGIALSLVVGFALAAVLAFILPRIVVDCGGLMAWGAVLGTVGAAVIGGGAVWFTGMVVVGIGVAVVVVVLLAIVFTAEIQAVREGRQRLVELVRRETSQ